jgi:hypothetical protein
LSRALVVVAVLSCAASAGAADEFPSLRLKRGTHVRLMVEDGPMRMATGRLLASDPDAITIETAGGAERVARERLFHVQYRVDSRDRKKGAVIGGAITGLAGFVAGIVLLVNESDGDGCAQCGIVVVTAGAVAAVPGAAIGYAIGAPGSDWRETKGRGLTVVGRGPARGVAVSLRMRVP